MHQRGRSKRVNLALIGATTVAVAAFDGWTSLGIAAPVLFTVPVLLTYWSESRKPPWIVALLETGLTLVGLLLSPAGGESVKVLVNRSLALVMIWVTASLVHRVKQAEFDRASAERRSRSTIDSSMDAIVAIDGAGLITDWNPQAEATFGWNRYEVLGRNLAEVVIPEEARDAHLGGLARFVRTGKGTILGDRLELEAVRRSGDRFPVELTITDCSGAGNVEFSGTIRDISDRLAAQRALEAYAADLHRSNEDLDSFAYAASHDLKAPLRAIDSLATWIAEDSMDSLSAESREDLVMLRSRIDRMQRLLDDLLAYSRIGRTEAALEVVDLAEVVEDATLLLDLPKGFEVRVGSLPEMVARRTLLVQVLVNLIGNAVKHRERDAGRVTVDARIEGDWIRFSVIDDGAGIDPEFHARIFELFQTLAPRDRMEGSGMGLAMVKKIVEREGGTVGVESRLGEGARFQFSWPNGERPEEKKDDERD